ncbi:MAG: deoB [Bacilli bacterium]|nr:deoB [Bacilli bacterium]
MFNRIILVELDSVGIGELPDAPGFGDQGSHTLAHIAARLGGIELPNLARMGLGCIDALQGVSSDAAKEGTGCYGKMIEISRGKDTMTGHWELMGIETKKPFKTFPDGFPHELIQELEQRFKRGILCNKPASGTQVIEQFGEEHMSTGSVIVYTSADPVLQIAAHEEIVPLEELYRLCEIAREATLRPQYLVGRVIARPFIGTPGNFTRTTNRHDYAVSPPEKTVLDHVKEAGIQTIAVGKIHDIFNGAGISKWVKTASNMEGVDQTIQFLNDIQNKTSFIFANLVDFDSLYGHRRDPSGYGQALMDFDHRVPELLEALRDDDLLLITADHGNDPTFIGTDHTREYVPLLAYSKKMTGVANLGIRRTFADVGATITDNFRAATPAIGSSFLSELSK